MVRVGGQRAPVEIVRVQSGGALGETNSVGFMFDHVGEIAYPASAANADAMLEAAIEAGASDVESDDNGHVVISAPDDFNAVRDALEQQFGAAESSRGEFPCIDSG